jgi:hypothetical protein
MENPNNSFVLETAAKDLLQKGRFDAEDAISCAAQALSYIFQATALENAQARQHKLNRLAIEALQLLRDSRADTQIEDMIKYNNPLGYLAKAWLSLTNDFCEMSALAISEFPRESKQ